MFELPEAKRVRRQDLDRTDEDSWDGDGEIEHDNALQARVNAQIAAALGLNGDEDDDAEVPAQRVEQTQTGNDVDNKDDVVAEDGGEEGYAFNLFSTSTARTGAVAKVILDDGADALGDGALVRPRPRSHYASGPASATDKERYRFAAVTADDIYERSSQRSWGMEMPWKVISIQATRKAKPSDKTVEVLMEDADKETKRKRPGKKTRILLRERTKIKAKAAEEAAKKLVDKEEHLKDKKKRLNRIKKLRKRAKEREKKKAAGEDVGEEDDDDSGSGDDE